MTQPDGESHDLDMVTLFSSSAHDAEMEANQVHQVLQASGIPSVVMGPSVIPSLEFQVQVPAESASDARRLLQEAEAAGPAAAAEAEAAGETSGGCFDAAGGDLRGPFST